MANLSGLAREIIFLTNYNTVSGRKRAKGPMLQKRANHDVFNNAMTEYFDLISNCGVANDGMGADCDTIAEFDLAFQNDIDIYSLSDTSVGLEHTGYQGIDN